MTHLALPAGGKLGSPLERTVLDDEEYILECSAMLRQHELLVSVQDVSSTFGQQCSARPMSDARRLSVRVWGGELPAPHQSAFASVSLGIRTTQGQLSIELPFHMRAAS